MFCFENFYIFDLFMRNDAEVLGAPIIISNGYIKTLRYYQKVGSFK